MVYPWVKKFLGLSCQNVSVSEDQSVFAVYVLADSSGFLNKSLTRARISSGDLGLKNWRDAGDFGKNSDDRVTTIFKNRQWGQKVIHFRFVNTLTILRNHCFSIELQRNHWITKMQYNTANCITCRWNRKVMTVIVRIFYERFYKRFKDPVHNTWKRHTNQTRQRHIS